MRLGIRSWIVRELIRPVWIVNEYGEFGIRILGVNCYYYKWDEPLIYERPLKWRPIRKREFGETILSQDIQPIEDVEK